MKALVYEHSASRWATTRLLSRLSSRVATSALSPLRLLDIPPPEPPHDEWVRVRPRLSGICGSDLATLTGRAGLYFSAVTSLPCVLGHELVGEVLEAGSEGGGFVRGERVVLEPTLDCEVRGIDPPCSACREGADGSCINVGRGALPPGLMTGFCAATGGGWGEELVAHRSQLHRVPDALSDADAVLIEPLACAVHAVALAEARRDQTVLILGGGTMGLLTLLALRRLGARCRVLCSARHPHQIARALALGADEAVPTGALLDDAIIERTGARRHEPERGESMVLGGVDLCFDCVGTTASLNQAVRLTRGRGTLVVVGMPDVLHGLQGTALWSQELKLVGAYTYGTDRFGERRARSFEFALEEAARKPGLLGRMVSRRFRLSDYRRAIETALRPGRSRTIKSVFELG